MLKLTQVNLTRLSSFIAVQDGFKMRSCSLQQSFYVVHQSFFFFTKCSRGETNVSFPNLAVPAFTFVSVSHNTSDSQQRSVCKTSPVNSHGPNSGEENTLQLKTNQFLPPDRK